MTIHDDAIREVHGVRCRDRSSQELPSRIIISEGNEMVTIDRLDSDGRSLTPYQARYLASKLYRLARRIRVRTGPVA